MVENKRFIIGVTGVPHTSLASAVLSLERNAVYGSLSEPYTGNIPKISVMTTEMSIDDINERLLKYFSDPISSESKYKRRLKHYGRRR